MQDSNPIHAPSDLLHRVGSFTANNNYWKLFDFHLILIKYNVNAFRWFSQVKHSVKTINK
jgi:hypothetical protein